MRKFLIVAAGLLGLAFYLFLWPTTVSARYRLTLNAEVDGQPKSGSGVIEITRIYNPTGQLLEIENRIRGEAFALDLGEKGKIFALLRPTILGKDGTGPINIIDTVWRDKIDAYPLSENKRRNFAALREASGTRDVMLDQLPMLVRFRDTNDPTTMEFLKPQNLEPNFGPGVKMTGATIEITRDEVTTGILRHLPWLNGFIYKWHGKPIDFDLDGHLTSDQSAHGVRLGSSDFVQGK